MLFPILAAFGVGYLIWRNKQPSGGFPGPIGPPAEQAQTRTWLDDARDLLLAWYQAVGLPAPSDNPQALWADFCAKNSGVQWDRVWPGINGYPVVQSALASRALPPAFTPEWVFGFQTLMTTYTDMVRRNTR